jgi:tRNA pseudouridine32 synthase/23S rRNA pseudouridine746 synthase
LQPQRNAFIVHRLDRAASGLILLAHGKQAARHLSALFQQRLVEKRYQVQVHGQYPEQLVSIDQKLDGRTAVSHVQRLEYDAHKDQSQLEVSIETGRKHQIRRHLAGAGFPVVGDRLYGQKKVTDDLRLQAVYLAFMAEPGGEKREYHLPK